ncbi:hypothetical protein HDV03_004516 [Kappamyces sp. JEL0829]|nr:hypothetical protein HDV03_004516 [Kappamyces sp. JEL0829]
MLPKRICPWFRSLWGLQSLGHNPNDHHYDYDDYNEQTDYHYYYHHCNGYCLTNQYCAGSGECCSEYGWCGTASQGSYCNANCQKGFALGTGSCGGYQPGSSSQPPAGFVYQSGGKLYVDGQAFRFASFNIPGLLLTEDRGSGPWQIPTYDEQLDALLTISLGAGRVARTYTLGYGAAVHVTGIGSYYEPAWAAFDQALAIARNLGIRLIVPLINNHNDGSLIFGDYDTFCQLAGKDYSVFYTDAALRQAFKNVISYMMGRVNTVNGIKYSDDSTILAIQLGNELGGWDSIAPAAWVLDIAQHIKSVAPNHLVMDGTEGYSITGKISSAVLNSPYIDIFTNHYYSGSSDVASISNDAAYFTSLGKAFIVGEYGFDTSVMSQILSTTKSNGNVAGTLAWSLRYHSRDGGFYVHDENGGQYYSYHAPGFPAISQFGTSDSTIVPLIRSTSLQMQGLASSDPIPPAPKAIAQVGSPLAIRFFGSAWAKSYTIRRKTTASGTGTVVASNVVDAVRFGQTIFRDTTAVSGQAYYYDITPVSLGGAAGSTLTIGPLSF